MMEGYTATSVEDRMKDERTPMYAVNIAFDSIDKAFMEWLESRNLELFPVPHTDDECPQYAIKPKDL